MAISKEQIDEINLLGLFDSPSGQEGIKVHSHSAAPEAVTAAERLHRKGLITQKDGGYLTPLGCEAVELSQKLINILSN